MERSQLFDQPSFIPVFKDYDGLKGQSIGLTGHLGVLGQILHSRLLDHGLQVAEYSGDINNLPDLEAWFSDNHFAYFFHLAAVVPLSEVANDPLTAYETNVIGSYNMCKELIKTQQDCWIFLASSSHVYKSTGVEEHQCLRVGFAEEPSAFYGMSKLAAEQITRPLLEHYSIPYCIGRIFSFSNAIQQEPYLVPTLRRKIMDTPEGDLLEIIDLDSLRDIMDGETVIDCVLHLAEKRFQGTVNIGSGKAMSVKDIACHVAKAVNRKVRIRGVNKHLPNSLVADVQKLKEFFSK